MLDVLKNRTYRHLLGAQVIALAGTGLLTVALGLLAYELAGDRAGAVLGTALAIKMLAYVGVAPIAGTFADLFPRRAFLVAMDLLRAAVALSLPFVTEVWQVYVLIFACSQRRPLSRRLSRPPFRTSCPTRTSIPVPFHCRGWPMTLKAWFPQCWQRPYSASSAFTACSLARSWGSWLPPHWFLACVCLCRILPARGAGSGTALLGVFEFISQPHACEGY